MNHIMHLDEIQFEEVSSSLKKIESRLNDEKRKKIHKGDIIEFYKRPENIRKINVKVKAISNYSTIKELISATPLEYWGPRFKDKEQLLNSLWHYTKEDIKKYGLLAIEIELL